MPERPTDFYFDTVTLSNFALAGQVRLLVTRYGPRAMVTPEVLDEVTQGVVAGYERLRDIELVVANGSLGRAEPLSPEEREAYRGLLRVLAPGEASCIACALRRGGVVVTDDRVARQSCTERSLRFTGTVGILKACCVDGQLSGIEADEILGAMIDAGYHSPVRRISDLL